MTWLLQTPHGKSPKLLQNILDQCGPAQKGGGAFAFASAQGIKLIGAEPVFQAFLKAHEFTMIVGLDAITDTRAVDELAKLSKIYPNFKSKLFLHSIGGSLFHLTCSSGMAPFFGRVRSSEGRANEAQQVQR